MTVETLAADGVERARELLRDGPPHCALVDVHLGNGNSLAFIRALKLHHPTCVVLVLSNDANDTLRRECLNLGADFFFDKSRSFERVVEIVKQLSAGAANG